MNGKMETHVIGRIQSKDQTCHIAGKDNDAADVLPQLEMIEKTII
jgi:hypothetical protein